MAKYFYFLAVLTLHLFAQAQCSESADTKEPPKLEAFANYEDMQNYFTSRKYRKISTIDNPTDDSYLDAYNKHNEQLNDEHKIVKREAVETKLPNEPVLIKFEATDAVEPSDELKQLIRQHRKLEKDNESADAKTKESERTAPKSAAVRTNAKSKKSRRVRRAAVRQQPQGFKVQMIPFEMSDAREPNEATKQHIKRMRALDLERAAMENTGYERQARTPKPITVPIPTQIMPTYQPKMRKSKVNSQRLKYKRRMRRSAQQTAPQMFKFDVEDAKDPDEDFKTRYTQQQKQRESKDLKESTLLKMEQLHNNTVTQETKPQDMNTEDDADDQSSHESKRMYVYKEAPLKAKKSINNLPPEVQKVITHLIKEHKGAKAYVKYIPAHKLDHEGYKAQHSAKLSLANYGTKLQPVTYVKYVEPAHKEQIQVAVPVPVPVPVVEKVRYVYTPVYQHTPQQQHAQPQHQQLQQSVVYKYVPAPAAPVAISQPIVVQEQPKPVHVQLAPSAEPHYTYTADYSQLYKQEERIAEQQAAQHAAQHAAKQAAQHAEYQVAQNAAQHAEHQAAQHAAQHASQIAAQHAAQQAAKHAAEYAEQQEAQHASQYAAKHAAQQAAQEAKHAAQLAAQHVAQQAADHQAAQHAAQHASQLAAQHAAQLAAQHASQPIKEFRPSKPDPTFESNKLVEIGNEAQHYSSAHQLPVNHYEYEVFPQPEEAHSPYGKAHLQLLQQPTEAEHATPAAGAPVIKIEYHAAPDRLKENYKELEEFKQLSSLIGKSPEDQIHGLTYLLAKEMQNQLKQQRQHKQLDHAPQTQTPRPQDSTAPIQFHTKHIPLRKHAPVSEHASLGVQPGRLIGMGKVKEYIPIVEAQVALEPKLPSEPAEPIESKTQQPYFGLGLSGNYEGVSAKVKNEPKPAKEQFVYRPVIGAKNLQSVYSSHQTAATEQKPSNAVHIGIQHSGDSSKLQYASKYAFGYRIRDFHTGNDFGHKQNRDLNGVTRGQYHILLPDGRIQNVIYHADDTGFHADVSFETGH